MPVRGVLRDYEGKRSGHALCWTFLAAELPLPIDVADAGRGSFSFWFVRASVPRVWFYRRRRTKQPGGETAAVSLTVNSV